MAEIVSAHVAEFDIDTGATVVAHYPRDPGWTAEQTDAVANLCLPDGGHLVEEDHILLVLRSSGCIFLQASFSALLLSRLFRPNRARRFSSCPKGDESKVD